MLKRGHRFINLVEKKSFTNKRDLISGLFWMGFGAVFAIGGLKQGLIRQGIPGPGSLPFIVGLISIGLSFIVFVQAFTKKSAAKEKFFPQQSSLPKLILALISLFIYGFLLKPIGFVLTTLVFLIFVLRLVGHEKWITAVSFSLLTAVLSYLLFTALQVQLPRGVWRF
jgi:putative tricarboxylic transport membrane protein